MGWRFLAFLFFAIVNDLIFAYNILMTILWSMIFIVSVYGWLMTYSLYIELSDLTKLEDLAHLRVSDDYEMVKDLDFKTLFRFRWELCSHYTIQQCTRWLDHVPQHLIQLFPLCQYRKFSIYLCCQFFRRSN